MRWFILSYSYSASWGRLRQRSHHLIAYQPRHLDQQLQTFAWYSVIVEPERKADVVKWCFFGRSIDSCHSALKILDLELAIASLNFISWLHLAELEIQAQQQVQLWRCSTRKRLKYPQHCRLGSRCFMIIVVMPTLLLEEKHVPFLLSSLPRLAWAALVVGWGYFRRQ